MTPDGWATYERGSQTLCLYLQDDTGRHTIRDTPDLCCFDTFPGKRTKSSSKCWERKQETTPVHDKPFISKPDGDGRYRREIFPPLMRRFLPHSGVRSGPVEGPVLPPYTQRCPPRGWLPDIHGMTSSSCNQIHMSPLLLALSLEFSPTHDFVSTFLFLCVHPLFSAFIVFVF